MWALLHQVAAWLQRGIELAQIIEPSWSWAEHLLSNVSPHTSPSSLASRGIESRLQPSFYPNTHGVSSPMPCAVFSFSFLDKLASFFVC